MIKNLHSVEVGLLMNDIEQARKLFFDALAFIDVSDFKNAELRLLEALSFTPGSVSILTNLAAVLLGQDNRIQARAYAEKAVAAKDDNVEALLILADCYATDEKLDESLNIYKKIEALNPGLAEVHNNIGFILARSGRIADAIASYERALTIEPDFADAYSNRGNAFFKLGRLDEARTSYQLALKCKPDSLKTANTLVSLLLSECKFAEALEIARHTLDCKKSDETKMLVGSCLSSPLANPTIGDLRDLLLQAISEPWSRPDDLAPTCVRFLALNEEIRNGLQRVAELSPHSTSAEKLIRPAATNISALAGDRLFCAMLELTPICNVSLERFVTSLRFGLLGTARSSAVAEVSEPLLAIYCAIARQCFVNNYVFSLSDEEIEQASALRDTLVASIEFGAAVPIVSTIAVAAYFPLHSLPCAASLLNRPWPQVVESLLRQQILNPIEETKLRTSIPVLTAINSVSMQVRDQYEESPYPQWVKAAPGHDPKTIDEFIRDEFALSSSIKFKKDTDVDVLVAGCGTGRHAIDAARRFKASRVLAIDVSMTSLCYAERQTRAFGLNNIKYAQADIMKLSTINQTFDVIEASGVLHHLADPFAGWSVLLSLLRPHGIMLLGLYSEVARRDIVMVRDFIVQRGYRPIADDIRKCREEIIHSTGDTALKRILLFRDFYSLNECRDLLFHIQEKQVSLPEIAAFLSQNDLQFLGFDLDLEIRRDYLRYFPSDIAMVDLAQWHQYEVKNPRTFLSMYNFWIQKKS
jgi:tetratricopeptide (TPR) repeat protein/SAM-dependent methyltransferase